MSLNLFRPFFIKCKWLYIFINIYFLSLTSTYAQLGTVIDKVEIGDTLKKYCMLRCEFPLGESNVIGFLDGKYYIYPYNDAIETSNTSGSKAFIMSIGILDEHMKLITSKAIITNIGDSCNRYINVKRMLLLWNEKILLFTEDILPINLVIAGNNKKQKIYSHKLYCQEIDKTDLESKTKILINEYESNVELSTNSYQFKLSIDKSKLGIFSYEEEVSHILIFNETIHNCISKIRYKSDLLPTYCNTPKALCSIAGFDTNEFMTLVNGFHIDNIGNTYLTIINPISNHKRRLNSGIPYNVPETGDSTEYKQLFFSIKEHTPHEKVIRFADEDINYWNVDITSNKWLFAGSKGIYISAIDTFNGKFTMNYKLFPKDLYNRLYSLSSNTEVYKTKPEFIIQNIFIRPDSGFTILGELINRKYLLGGNGYEGKNLLNFQDIIILKCTNDLNTIKTYSINRTPVKYEDIVNTLLLKSNIYTSVTAYYYANAYTPTSFEFEDNYYVLFNDNNKPVICKISPDGILREEIPSLHINKMPVFLPYMTIESDKKALTLFSVWKITSNKSSLCSKISLIKLSLK